MPLPSLSAISRPEWPMLRLPSWQDQARFKREMVAYNGGAALENEELKKENKELTKQARTHAPYGPLAALAVVAVVGLAP